MQFMLPPETYPTYRYLVPGTSPILRAGKKAHCSTAVQPGTAGQATEAHGAVRRFAALLSYSWAELSWECIFWDSTMDWYVQTWCINSTDTWYYHIILRIMPVLRERVSTAKHAARRSTAQYRTEYHTARQGTALLC